MSAEAMTGVSSEQLNTIDEASTVQHPIVLLGDELVDDLRTIGVNPGDEAALEQARRQAAAAVVLRYAGRAERRIQEIEQTRDLEIQAIVMHYARGIAPLRERLGVLIRYVEDLASLSTWGKKKSHDTPYGSFGVRDSAESVTLADRKLTTGWAVANRPELVRVTAKIPYADAVERFTETELLNVATLDVEWGELKKQLDPAGELPPGVEKVAATRESFAKPAVLTLT